MEHPTNSNRIQQVRRNQKAKEDLQYKRLLAEQIVDQLEEDEEFKKLPKRQQSKEREDRIVSLLALSQEDLEETLRQQRQTDSQSEVEDNHHENWIDGPLSQSARSLLGRISMSARASGSGLPTSSQSLLPSQDQTLKSNEELELEQVRDQVQELVTGKVFKDCQAKYKTLEDWIGAFEEHSKTKYVKPVFEDPQTTSEESKEQEETGAVTQGSASSSSSSSSSSTGDKANSGNKTAKATSGKDKTNTGNKTGAKGLDNPTKPPAPAKDDKSVKGGGGKKRPLESSSSSANTKSRVVASKPSPSVTTSGSTAKKPKVDVVIQEETAAQEAEAGELEDDNDERGEDADDHGRYSNDSGSRYGTDDDLEEEEEEEEEEEPLVPEKKSRAKGGKQPKKSKAPVIPNNHVGERFQAYANCLDELAKVHVVKSVSDVDGVDNNERGKCKYCATRPKAICLGCSSLIQGEYYFCCMKHTTNHMADMAKAEIFCLMAGEMFAKPSSSSSSK